MRKACEPVHVQWSYADNTVKAVNATLRGYEGAHVTATVYDMEGREVKRYSREATLTVHPNSAVEALRLPLPADGNLARGKRAVCSSSGVTDYHAAEAVTDGNTGSAWSATGGEGEWVYVDLGAPTRFSTIVLSWESEVAARYDVLVSDDAETWRTVHVGDKGSSPIDEITIEPVTARYVKVLDVKSRQPGRKMALYEIELYDTEAEPAGLSPVHFIRLRLTDAAGKLLSENFYWRSNRLGDYRALDGLEPARRRRPSARSASSGRRSRTAAAAWLSPCASCRPTPRRANNCCPPSWTTTISRSFRARGGR